MSKKDKAILAGMVLTIGVVILPQALNLYDLIREKLSGSVRVRKTGTSSSGR